MLKTANQKVAILLMIVSVFYIGLASRLPTYPYIPVDSDVIPIGLGVVLFGLSIALFFMKDEKTEEEKKEQRIPKQEIFMMLSVLVSAFLFIVLFDILGFLLDTLLFLFFVSWFLGYKQFISNAIVSIAVSFGIYFLFTGFLKIQLPQGILPF